MGLFDKLFESSDSANEVLDQREAFSSILLVTVASDGHISSEEAEAFLTVSNRMQLFRDQPPQQFNAMMNKLQGLLAKRGPGFLLQKAVEVLPSELRETAFAISADLIFADGALEVQERKVLEELQIELNIPDNLAIKILEVIAIKNRG